jgi:hypothetical protein
MFNQVPKVPKVTNVPKVLPLQSRLKGESHNS